VGSEGAADMARGCFFRGKTLSPGPLLLSLLHNINISTNRRWHTIGLTV